MNLKILRQYINEYKLNFDSVNQLEIFKWHAVKCFQDNWNPDDSNFTTMLSRSLTKTKNLLVSGNYFPIGMINLYTEQKPIEVRKLFLNLFNEELDLLARINDFQIGIENLNKELFNDKKSYQDHRAIIVYLVLRYPERYYFYKFKMFQAFSAKLELSFTPTRGNIGNIGQYYTMCELIRFELSKDQELLKLHKQRIGDDCYYDENLNILTQDLIYSTVRHLKLNVTTTDTNISTYESNITEVLSSSLTTSNNKVNLSGRFVNFVHNNAENKRIGDLGEDWVIKYEMDKLKKANKNHLVKKIKHVSRVTGDGTGYDIQSFDTNGNNIFIEVKTTKGAKNSIFYITRNELEKSIINSSNYYLYRVYNFNEETSNGDLFIIKGELTRLCTSPLVFKVEIEESN